MGTNDTHTCSVTFGDGDPAVAGVVTESGGAGNGQVNVVVFLPGAAFAIEATGLVNVPRTPDGTCPLNESASIVRLDIGLVTVFFNEMTTNAAGELVWDAIRVPPILLTPGQEIILAG